MSDESTRTSSATAAAASAAPQRVDGAWIVRPARALAILCALMAVWVVLRDYAIADQPRPGAHWGALAFVAMSGLFGCQAESIRGNKTARVVMLVAATLAAFFAFLWVSAIRPE